jgi:Cu/Ag efflux pump CusA
MIDALLAFSIRQRWLILLLALGTAALGLWNFTRLPIDAVPDITNVQVQINSRAPGYSPLETEQRITFPVETAMAGPAPARHDPFPLALWLEPGHCHLSGRHRHLFCPPARQ